MKKVLCAVLCLLLGGCMGGVAEMRGFGPHLTGITMSAVTKVSEQACVDGVAASSRQMVVGTVYYGNSTTTRPIAREEATARAVIYCR